MHIKSPRLPPHPLLNRSPAPPRCNTLISLPFLITILLLPALIFQSLFPSAIISKNPSILPSNFNNDNLLSQTFQTNRRSRFTLQFLFPEWSASSLNISSSQHSSSLPKKLHNILFTNYTAFHKTALQRLRESPNNPPDRYLIWKCARGKHECAGVGDRFRGIMNIYMLAVITGRVFGVQWRDGEGGIDVGGLERVLVPRDDGIDWMSVGKLVGEQGITLPWYKCEGGGRKCRVGNTVDMPSVEDLPGPPEDEEFWDDDQGWDYGNKGRGINLLKDNVEKLLRGVKVIKVETRLFFRMDAFMVNPFFGDVGNAIKEAVKLGVTNDLVQRLLLRRLFQPAPGLLERVGAFKAVNSEVPLIRSEYVGIHVRNGADFRENAFDSRFQNVTNNRRRTAHALLMCLQSLGYGGGTMFLATDDYVFKSFMRNFTVLSGKWNVVYNDAPALHNDQGPVLGAPHGLWKYTGNIREGEHDPFVDIFADLLLLSHGKIVVGATRSGFTHLAFVLGNAKAMVYEANKECKAFTIRDSPLGVSAKRLAGWL